MSDQPAGLGADQRLGPHRAAPGPSLRRVARAAGMVLACLLHAALGVTVSVSGLIMPTNAVRMLGVFWIAGVVVMIQGRRRPELILAVPIVSWTVWFAVAWVGQTWLGWKA